MGVIYETTNAHLEYELRRESFIIHDDELPTPFPPEFGYERVYGLIALLQRVEESERFQRWLARRENYHYSEQRMATKCPCERRQG
jgi:hypothetical protein